ncbi:hypothetical protein HELRODRAFT_180099 [Helobdella robusta]|uniref:Secreted protein n=1 Tax=Helobdella robusta TaxID=6412 RepID=T1FFH0_HELRO|nr:hypothetical protein HELRODRAFT_180099 [Helobdella robusta]ESN94767.1 hypothetical protein HELRODRAFT_180099 [Helobdella robusta]
MGWRIQWRPLSTTLDAIMLLLSLTHIVVGQISCCCWVVTDVTIEIIIFTNISTKHVDGLIGMETWEQGATDDTRHTLHCIVPTSTPYKQLTAIVSPSSFKQYFHFYG